MPVFGGATCSGADFVVAYLHVMGSDMQESVAVTVLATNLLDKLVLAVMLPLGLGLYLVHGPWLRVLLGIPEMLPATSLTLGHVAGVLC